MTEPLDFNKVVSWLNTQWKGDKACPVCKHNDWAVGPRVLELREFHGGTFVVGSTLIQPLVVLTCQVCGHVLLFSASAVGLWPPAEKPAATAAPSVPTAPSPEDKP